MPGPPLVPPLLLRRLVAGKREGESEGGREEGEKTAHNLGDTQQAFLPRGVTTVWAPGLSRDLYNLAQ